MKSLQKNREKLSSEKHDVNFTTANDKSSHPLSKRTHKTFPQWLFPVFYALPVQKLERCIGNFFLHKSSEEVGVGTERESSGFMVFIIYFCIALGNDHRMFWTFLRLLRCSEWMHMCNRVLRSSLISRSMMLHNAAKTFRRFQVSLSVNIWARQAPKATFLSFEPTSFA